MGVSASAQRAARLSDRRWRGARRRRSRELPPTLVAIEGWPPNVAKATALLHPVGAVVVADPEEPPLLFADDAFDLVTSRHPATVSWSEIARVLAPGGTYFAQHVDSGTNVEISEYFLGPLEASLGRHHEIEADQARAAGLEIVQCRNERLRLELFDVGAMVYFLRQVIWTVPDFTVDRYRDRLKEPPRPDRTRWRLPLDHVSNTLRCPQATILMALGFCLWTLPFIAGSGTPLRARR